MRFIEALGRFNAAHPWSHNDAYVGFVLRQARTVRRRGGTTAVDVGCGTGNLLRRLATSFPYVTGIEQDAETARIAAESLSAFTAVTILHRSFGDEPAQAYDLIAFIASLHHLPLYSALERARLALRPGGRIVIVGVARETRADAFRSSVSLLLNPLVGLIRHPRRATGTPPHMRAPTAQPRDSFPEIQRVAREILPGIRMRRRLFWRYTAVWSAPE